jgi:translation elongation factor P/translation initiation factor 5A
LQHILSNRKSKFEKIKRSEMEHGQNKEPIKDSKNLIEKNELNSNELTKNIQDQEKFEFVNTDEFWEDDLYSSLIGCQQMSLI